MIKLAITGGIGSGKSYIARQMTQLLGIPVYDSDSRAKLLYQSSPEVIRQLKAIIPGELYDQNGNLSKDTLAAYLFASDEHAAQINAIVHPAVKADFLEWASQQQAPIVAIETALLAESGIDKVVDKVIRVDAPLELRIERAMKRDGTTKEKVLERISRQQEYPSPDIIINNV